MLRRLTLLANLVVVPAGLLAQHAEPPLRWAASAAQRSPASFQLELDRAINILNRGLKESWSTRDQYLGAFQKTPATDLMGHPVNAAKEYVVCAMGAQFRSHQTWNGGAPIAVEVHRAIVNFTKLRSQAAAAKATPSVPYTQTAGFRAPPCASFAR